MEEVMRKSTMTAPKVILALISTALLAGYFAIPARIWQLLEPRAQAASFVVTNTTDGNAGSLREAINNANTTLGPHTITFNIPAKDPRHFYYVNDGVSGTVSRSMIAVTSASDDTTIVDIDPDWPHSWYSIETAGFIDGVQFTEVTIDGFSQPGSVPNTNPSGPLNSVLKIEVTNSATDNTCSRIFRGIVAQLVVKGMAINGCGVSSGARLVDFEAFSDSSIAAGNYLGTDPSGTIAMGSGYGVHISQSNSVRVGGADPADRNLISGNFRGVTANNGGASGAGFTHTIIEGNLIGTKRDGVSPLGNGLHPEQPTQRQDGVQIVAVAGYTNSNRIEGNVIVNSARYGIDLTSGGVGTGGNIYGNRFVGNSIHSNGNVGINLDGNDLGPFNPVTANDPCDADDGFNGLQNYPVISSATISGGNVMIAGTLNSISDRSYRVEFFASTAADATGFGEGQTFLGSTMVTVPSGSCDGTFNVSLPIPGGAGTYIAATATDPDGSTSEFSAVHQAVNQTPCGVINGDLTVANTTDVLIDLSCVTGVTGNVTITGNTNATTISMGSLQSVGGNIEISGNLELETIAMGGMESATDIEISGNLDLSSISMGNLQTAGNLEITDNGMPTISLGGLENVTGDLIVQSVGTGEFSAGAAAPGGELDLDLSGYTSVTGASASGETSISNAAVPAVMSVELPEGSFTAPVAFSITRQEPSSLEPTPGTLPDGAPGFIDPLEAYQFTFGVPTLNQNATLMFEILVDGLDQPTRDALLAAIASGNATLATLGDAPGSTYQTFSVCGSGQDPTAGGCVRLELLDANRQPTSGTPAIVRFTGVVGHFSTWAVAMILGPTAAPASISGRVMDGYGRGLRGVVVLAQGLDGTVRTAVTNTFGHYKLVGIMAGRSYVLSASSRRYAFENNFRLVDLSADLVDENFVTGSGSMTKMKRFEDLLTYRRPFF
jgi:hypothetical protein